MKRPERRKKKILFVALIPLTFFMMTSFRGGGRHTYTYPEGWDLKQLELADGIYQGESEGFRSGLTVEVTVTDGAVSNVAVVDHNEVGPQYYRKPISLIPGQIVEEQNTNVDSVTGATATSVGIMSAVENALEQARN